MENKRSHNISEQGENLGIQSHRKILKIKEMSRVKKEEKTPRMKKVKLEVSEDTSLEDTFIIDDSMYYEEYDKNLVIRRAEEIFRSIPADHPKFRIQMIPSRVYQNFWLILPNKFCKTYMPNKDAEVILIDENEKSWTTKYLVSRHGLSGGWRGFSINHRLMQGDILVFHMISPDKFKVSIVRVFDLKVVDDTHVLVEFSGVRV